MRTNNKLNPHMASTPGIEPGPHGWETSALTTVPSLLPLHVNMHHNPVEHADRVSKLDLFLALPKFLLVRVAYTATEKTSVTEKMDNYLNLQAA